MAAALSASLLLAAPAARAWPVAAPAGALASPIVAAAQAIAHRGPPRDCSAFVLAAYARAGHPIKVGSSKTGSLAEGLFGTLRDRGQTLQHAPVPGDLAFFRDTWGDAHGRVTHVSLVERIEDDGTVVLLDRLNRGVTESRMNLASPHDSGKNSGLRRGHAAGQAVLAGELFVAFGRP